MESNSCVLLANASWRVQFREAVRLFLTDCKFRNLAPITIQFYKWELQRLEKFLVQVNLDLLHLIPADLKQWLLHYLLNKKITPNSINCLIQACKVLFKFLTEENILENDVAVGLILIKAQNQMVFTFTEEHVKSILAEPNPTTFTGFRDYVMMVVLLETGIRVMELANMKFSEIDFIEKIVRIPNFRSSDAKNSRRSNSSSVLYKSQHQRDTRVVPYFPSFDGEILYPKWQ